MIEAALRDQRIGQFRPEAMAEEAGAQLSHAFPIACRDLELNDTRQRSFEGRTQIRIISARQATRTERQRYEEENG